MSGRVASGPLVDVGGRHLARCDSGRSHRVGKRLSGQQTLTGLAHRRRWPEPGSTANERQRRCTMGSSRPPTHVTPDTKTTTVTAGAPGTTRTCDLGIRRPLLYPPELRRQCAGQSIQTGIQDQCRRHDGSEKSSAAPKIGYGVSLDTRTTPAGKRPLTATTRVPDVEGWALLCAWPV